MSWKSSKPDTVRQRDGSKTSDTLAGISLLPVPSLVIASADAELVAFGVGHRVPFVRPLAGGPKESGATGFKLSTHLVLVPAVEAHVPVNPVLEGLLLGNGLEQDAPLGGLGLEFLFGPDGRAVLPHEPAVVGHRFRLGGV